MQLLEIFCRNIVNIIILLNISYHTKKYTMKNELICDTERDSQRK